MNRDRQTRSPHRPDQRLNVRPTQGEVITYQDSAGRDLETDEDENDWSPRLPSSAINYQRLADIQTEDYPRAGKNLVVQSRRTTIQHLPPGVVLIRGIPCTNVGGTWMKVQTHDTPPPEYTQPQRQTEDIPIRQPRRRTLPRFHWLVFVGIALSLMVAGWILFNSLAGWLQGKYDDFLYGRPRTYQTDAIVGHADSPTNPSHFQCINLNKHIQVIEFPGGDSSKSKVYEGPTLLGPGQELIPCTLSFRDINGDGKPDMILSIGGEIFVMINENGSFRSVRPGEHIHLEGEVSPPTTGGE